MLRYELKTTFHSIRFVEVHNVYYISVGLIQDYCSYFTSQGLLAFYGLPLAHTLVQVSTGIPTSLPEGVKFEMPTLPVNYSNSPCSNFEFIYNQFISENRFHVIENLI